MEARGGSQDLARALKSEIPEAQRVGCPNRPKLRAGDYLQCRIVGTSTPKVVIVDVLDDEGQFRLIRSCRGPGGVTPDRWSTRTID